MTLHVIKVRGKNGRIPQKLSYNEVVRCSYWM